MTTKHLLFICLVLFSKDAFNQNNIFPSSGSAGIGTTTPNASSLMEMVSTTKGLLIPRMTQTQRDAIVSPVTGLMIYQTTNTPGFYYYNGTSWTPISTKGANMSLSNLKSPTAVNMNLQPGAHGTIDLGSNSFGWRDIYSTGAFYINGTRAFAAPDTTNTFVGKEAGLSNAGIFNTAVGTKSLFSNVNGWDNTAIGAGTLWYNTNGSSNCAVGTYTMKNNTSGGSNTAVGTAAMLNNTTGSANAAFGESTLALNISGRTNTAIGAATLYANVSGYSNVAIGAFALNTNEAGSNLVAVGDSALFSNQDIGIKNTAIGSKSLYSNTIGGNNTAIGFQSLYSNTTGSDNSAIGVEALNLNTTGSDNVAIGPWSMNINTTGSKNTAVGEFALWGNKSGNDNVALGFGALNSNYTGHSNIAIGTNALARTYDDGNIIAIGDSALHDMRTINSYNMAIGSKAMYKTTTGSSNTALGFNSLYFNTTGYGNTGAGFLALYDNSTGYYNTGFGDGVLYQNTSGYGNTAVGISGLFTNATGYYNTAFGYGADVTAGNLSNATAIGYGTLVNASNKAVIGNNSVSVIGGHVGWSILSDGRFKNNIKENVPGLEFVNKLRPVTYNIDETKYAKFIGVKDSVINVQKDAYTKASQKIRTGFIAQEVEKTAQEMNYDFDGVNHPQNDKDNYSLVYADFVPSLVKAVQQLSKQVEDQQKEIDEMKAMLSSKSGTTSAVINSSNVSSAQMIDLGSSLKLEQNIPNPFNASTTIKYYLPVNNGNVYMNFYNNNGALLKSVKLNGTGNGSVTVNAHDLPSGTYRYTLVSDGKLIDSKSMIAGK